MQKSRVTGETAEAMLAIFWNDTLQDIPGREKIQPRRHSAAAIEAAHLSRTQAYFLITSRDDLQTKQVGGRLTVRSEFQISDFVGFHSWRVALRKGGPETRIKAGEITLSQGTKDPDSVWLPRASQLKRRKGETRSNWNLQWEKLKQPEMGRGVLPINGRHSYSPKEQDRAQSLCLSLCTYPQLQFSLYGALEMSFLFLALLLCF